MNILYLAHRIPYPPNKGDKLRAFHQIERLSEHHSVWCACFVDVASDMRHVDGLRKYCRGVIAIPLRRRSAAVAGLWGWLRGSTITESFYNHPAMHDALRRLTSEVDFDAVVAFSSSVAPYALSVPADRRTLDLCDLDSLKWGDYARRCLGPMRWVYATEARRLARREREFLDMFDATLLITRNEAAGFGLMGPHQRLHIVGNGVHVPEPSGLMCSEPQVLEHLPDSCSEPRASARADLRCEKTQAGHRVRYTKTVSALEQISISCAAIPTAGRAFYPATSRGLKPAPRADASITQSCEANNDHDDAAIVGFVGAMDYKPNVEGVRWLAAQCWPAIRRACPEAVFRIVGRSPVRAVRKLAKLPGVEVTGEVPDAGAEVARFTVSVAPLHTARGLQNKVLEAMAAARPVVLTSQAAAGIDAVNGRHYLVADTASRLSDNVIELLHDPAMRQSIGHAARDFVQLHHQWGRELDKFEAIVTGDDAPSRSSIHQRHQEATVR